MRSATATAPPSTRLLAVSWIATLATSIAAIVLLHGLGHGEPFAVEWSDPWGWLGAHSPERVLMAAGRLVALGLAYWVAGSLMASTVARASGVPALIRSVDWLTLPTIRRMAERTVAISLTASTFAGSGAAMVVAAGPLPPADTPHLALRQLESAPVPRYVPVPAGDPPSSPGEEHPEPSYVPTPAGAPQPFPVAPSPTGATSDAAPPSNPAPAVPQTRPDVAPRRFDPAAADVLRSTLRRAGTAYHYTVVQGDNLWRISQGHLADVLDRRPSESETARYWAHLVAANGARLRSGNPDLIYPGEVVVCPATTNVGIGG